MEKRTHKIVHGLIGASGGLAGLVPLFGCSGNCTACFGCAGFGIGLALIVIGRKIRRRKGADDGVV